LILWSGQAVVMGTTVPLLNVNSQLLMVTVDSNHDAGHT
jgi:hypothetical protein